MYVYRSYLIYDMPIPFSWRPHLWLFHWIVVPYLWTLSWMAFWSKILNKSRGTE